MPNSSALLRHPRANPCISRQKLGTSAVPATSTRGCEYVERARLATLPRQPLNVDAHAYGAKDKKRQRNCKKDGVPIHVVLLFGATALQKIMRKTRVVRLETGHLGPGSGLTAAPSTTERPGLTECDLAPASCAKLLDRGVRNRRIHAAHPSGRQPTYPPVSEGDAGYAAGLYSG
jgi:hypothetical protein